MAKDSSFDIVSDFDKMELSNALEQTKKEVSARFDLKDSNSKIELEEDKKIVITTKDETKLKNIVDILQTKMIKRNLSIQILDAQNVENALGGCVRQVFNLKKGLDSETAKKISQDIKQSKIKVQVSILGDELRVSGKSKDDLQQVIKMVKENEEKYSLPLQFQNYR